MTAIDKILAQKSIRITPMRQLILTHFKEGKKLFGLSELEDAFPMSDRITIYRTLKTFVGKGLLHSIQNGQGEAKYALCGELCGEQEHMDKHPHFHCLNCGEFECLESILIPDIILPVGYTSTEIGMTIKGTCKRCQI